MYISKNWKYFIAIFSTLTIIWMLKAQDSFVKVNGTHFEVEGKAYYFLGTNFWYGLNLGAKKEGGNRDRLTKELDHLKHLGVNNLRIMAASEGPDNEPWRMVPSLQPNPGEYNQDVLEGLDFLLAEMHKRKMYAVVCLNNFWPWSGGMAQYLRWFEGKEIPYPPPAEKGDWATYQLYTIKFFKHEQANQAFRDHIQFIINRKNSYTNLLYKNDPTIMAWELANEPRGILKPAALQKWIHDTAEYIKSIDSNHLVTVGSEGRTSSKFAGTNFRKDHQSKYIDYSTIHIWVQNWGWYDPKQGERSFVRARKKAGKYLKRHIKWAEKLGKPVVLEEFGISRDQDNHDSNASTEYRDSYYKYMFDEIYRYAVSGRAIAGCNFWAWGGSGRPRVPKAIWKAGDDFIGDPPHEYQGWYSVYDKDESTLSVIEAYAKKMNLLGE